MILANEVFNYVTGCLIHRDCGNMVVRAAYLIGIFHCVAVMPIDLFREGGISPYVNLRGRCILESESPQFLIKNQTHIEVCSKIGIRLESLLTIQHTNDSSAKV